MSARARLSRVTALLLGAGVAVSGCAAGGGAPVEDRSRGVGLPATDEAAVRPDAGTADSPRVGAPAALGEGPPASGPSTTREPAAPSEPAARENPAVVALLNRANRDSLAGRHALAAASLERAIKIEPGNAWLWHRLAAARLDQGRPGEAASLAAKSNALAAEDRTLRARNWRLIARVHRLRGEERAAREAERRARDLDNPAS